MAAPVIDRARWAVQNLDVEPDDLVLEIGCGRGAAAALVCERLTTGRIVAIDRSPVMVTFAQRRNQRCLAAGRAEFLAVALADFNPGRQRFGKIFAVNVSAFWLGPALEELRHLQRLLARGGAIYLCYEQPTEERIAAIEERLIAGLTELGLVTAARRSQTGRSARLCVIGTSRSP
ncbi:MAG TPA: class I SAM-dependent methyltransferase [Micromonosporaceae bacterium]|nr:class I SAM-dependent methyltransferase [Micromonosporaceae bacterium]